MNNWNRNNEDRNNCYDESYNYNEDYNYNFLERDKEMEIIKLRHKNKKKVFIIVYLILGIFSSLMIFCIWFYNSKNVDPSDVASSTTDKDINAKSDSDNDKTKPISKLSSEEVYKKCSKSVVGIVVVKQGFDFFYGTVKNKGQGSGVVVSSDGYILTNAHVVDGADDMQVSFIDNSEKYFKAKLIGKDKNNDLAVIKVEREGLTPAVFGSSQLSVGQKVYAIGNPYGLESTMTSGEISSLNRQINDDETKYIQTTAAINPGNSGGGMFDEYGKLVGIPSAKLAQADNIGFAIPSNTAKDVADRLVKRGPITRKERIWDKN